MLVLLDLGRQRRTALPQAWHNFRIVYNMEMMNVYKIKGNWNSWDRPPLPSEPGGEPLSCNTNFLAPGTATHLQSQGGGKRSFVFALHSARLIVPGCWGAASILLWNVPALFPVTLSLCQVNAINGNTLLQRTVPPGMWTRPRGIEYLICIISLYRIVFFWGGEIFLYINRCPYLCFTTHKEVWRH